MKKFVAAVLVAASAFVAQGFTHSHNELCEGFVPPNDMRIPVGALRAGGISQGEFNAVLDRIEKIYKSKFAAKGATFVVKRGWTDATVNASAEQQGKNWIINMYGGLARHTTITKDGFALVACHEVGHHLGGAPKVSGWWSIWASNEGQSDYYSSLKCLRWYYDEDDNEKVVSGMTIDPYLRKSCEAEHRNREDQLFCMRSGMAGMSVAMLFKDLRKENKNPSFDTPDPKKVTQTDDAHPMTQCRLDTYFAGALCTARLSDALSDTDYKLGTCVDKVSEENGLRPNCWFKPN